MATTNPTQPGEQEIEKMVREYQMLQEQLRGAALQLDQMQNVKADLERAKSEIEKASGKVYISVGSVIVETTKEKALSDVTEKAEIANVRLQSANKQYTEFKTREKQLGEKITQIYQQGRGAQGAQ